MQASDKTVARGEVRFLRWVTLLEGLSLIILVCIAVPIKYIGGDPSLVKLLGPIHGILFIVFVYAIWSVGNQLEWDWSKMVWKILFATFIPFGTFYLDHKVLRHL